LFFIPVANALHTVFVKSLAVQIQARLLTTLLFLLSSKLLMKLINCFLRCGMTREETKLMWRKIKFFGKMIISTLKTISSSTSEIMHNMETIGS